MRRLIVSAVLVALAITAVSCSDSPRDDAAQRPDVLRRGNGGEPGTLDPARAEDIHAFNILTDTHEGLVAQAANGDLIPGVAESWTVSADGRIYTFQLRDNARWSNGEPLLAEDFVRSMRRAVAPTTASAYAFLLARLANFSEVNSGARPLADLGVSAPSEHVLEIRLSARTSYWLSILAQPISFPSHVSGDAAISNGAFVIVDRRAGSHVRLQKNVHYWAADTVDLEEVVYLPIVDPLAEFNAYRTGEIDMTHTLGREFLQVARNEFPDEVHIAPTLALYYLAFDLNEPPFDNTLLRQALTMAIDREQLSNLLGRGELPAYSVVPPGVAAYVGTAYEWQGFPRDDVQETARRIYAEAGYSRERPLVLNYLYDAGDDVHERVALAVTGMWRDVLGVESTLVKREWMYFLDSRFQRKDWDVMRFAWFGDYNAPNTFLDIFESNNEQNLALYENNTYDSRLRKAASEPDWQLASSYLRDAEDILINDYPIAPLYFFVSKRLVRLNIGGYEDNVVDRHPSRFLTIDSRFN